MAALCTLPKKVKCAELSGKTYPAVPGTACFRMDSFFGQEKAAKLPLNMSIPAEGYSKRTVYPSPFSIS